MNATVDIRVHDAEVHALVQQIYQACGMGATDAALMADSHVESDLRGAHSHGVLRVPGYVDRLVDGGVNPQGQPSVSREEFARNGIPLNPVTLGDRFTRWLSAVMDP